MTDPSALGWTPDRDTDLPSGTDPGRARLRSISRAVREQPDRIR